MSLTLLSSECEKDMDCRLHLINNTTESLWFDIDCYNYPDSLLWTGNCYDEEVSPNSNKELCIKRTWEDIFSSNNIKALKIYVINNDTAHLYEMLTIIKEVKYYQIYELSLEDLESKDWKIVYP